VPPNDSVLFQLNRLNTSPDTLTFVVPLACVAYYPVLAILGRSDPLGAPDWLLPFTPLAGFAFLGLSFLAWRVGMARYASTGS